MQGSTAGFPSSKVERNIVQNVEEQENIISIVQEHPEVSTRRISGQLGVPHVRFWTLNTEGCYIHIIFCKRKGLNRVTM